MPYAALGFGDRGAVLAVAGNSAADDMNVQTYAMLRVKEEGEKHFVRQLSMLRPKKVANEMRWWHRSTAPYAPSDGVSCRLRYFVRTECSSTRSSPCRMQAASHRPKKWAHAPSCVLSRSGMPLPSIRPSRACSIASRLIIETFARA